MKELIREDSIIRESLKDSIRGEIRKILRRIKASFPELELKPLRKKYFPDFSQRTREYRDEEGYAGIPGKIVPITFLESENARYICAMRQVDLSISRLTSF